MSRGIDVLTYAAAKAYTDKKVDEGGGGDTVKELTTADYNWPTTGTKTAVALWLLPSGIYKGPASSSINVYATRSQDYSMGAGFPSYAIVKECESDANNRAIVTYVDGTNGNVVEYYGIDSDGRNYSIKNFPNVVQTTGTSTTNVMSQNATTSMVFADPATRRKVSIGDSANAAGIDCISIGTSSNVLSGGTGAVSIGDHASASGVASIALGCHANATERGQMDISTGTYSSGYKSTKYRLLTGVYDGQSAHDAATVGQVNSVIDAINTALSTNIPHIGA